MKYYCVLSGLKNREVFIMNSKVVLGIVALAIFAFIYCEGSVKSASIRLGDNIDLKIE